MKKYLLLIILFVISIISLRGITKGLYPSYSYTPVIDAPEDTILAFIIDGEVSDTPPTTNNYYAHVECNDSGATGTITWTGTAWNISISNISEETKCDVYFDELAPRGWSTAPAGTLIAGIKSNQSEPNQDDATGMTVPGIALSTTDEGLRVTEDDYGYTYYYRGTVENNYVVFANMCWRVARIVGNGSIKLVLYNNNSTNSATPCDASLDDTLKSHTDNIGSKFNNYDNKNTYIGFMYSNNPDSTDYNIVHANDNDSTLLTTLKTWYDSKFSAAHKNQLADVIWCNDKRPLTDTTFNPWGGSGTILGTGVGTDKTYYMGSYRILIHDNTPHPSLKCGDDINDNKISKFTAADTIYGNGALNGYKIGLLTADEFVYAGTIGVIQNLDEGSGNTDFYLSKNDSGSWTLTPFDFDGRGGGFNFNSSGNFTDTFLTSPSGVRPAIALKSNTTISGGNGAQSNPFVIN